MAETKSQLITIEGLSVFLDNVRTETDAKIAAIGQGVTYSLSKNANGEIVLTGSDSSVTKVTDKNTTYGFSQSGTTLTITPSEGDPITITMGEEITSAKIIAALGFTPAKTSDIPDDLADLSDDATHRLVTDTEKSTWNAKGSYSKPEGGIPKTDLAEAVQTSLGKADSALQEHQDISGKADKATTVAGYGITDAVTTAMKDVANGYAGLDENGLIPTSILPGSVDEIIEAAKKSAFPKTGESSKIYVALDTNLTYRWSGTEYVEISPSLALGETSSTAYAGDKGKAVTDAFNTHKDNGDIHVTADNKTAWNAKYDKPSTGIPASDLASGVIPTTLPASDVKAWAKADTKPTYTASEVGALPNTTVIPTITDTYSATSSDGMSGKAVASALSDFSSEVISATEPTGQKANQYWLQEY